MDPGLVIGGKYHVVRLIAEGGMGAVYDAIHGVTGRRVALKLISELGLARGAPALRRFEREAKATGAIDSRHVVQVLDAGEDEASGMPFLVMEFLEGEDLRAVLRRGPLPAAQALQITAEVCAGLVEAHAADIVHRDLKPGNLFLAEAGEQTLVKILDFGIAKLLDEESSARDVTRTGEVVGSPPYMSPEQLTSPGDVDHRSDIWSLGVVLYEMLTGATPTAGINTIGARVHAICHVPAASLSDRVAGIRPEVATLVHRALALDPNARFSSAREMLDALRALQPVVIEIDKKAREGLTRPSAFFGARSAALGAVGIGLVATVIAVVRPDLRGRVAPSLAVATAVTNTNTNSTEPAASRTASRTVAAAPGSAALNSASFTSFSASSSLVPAGMASAGSGAAPRTPTDGARKLGGAAHTKAGGAGAPVPGPAVRVEATGREQL